MDKDLNGAMKSVTINSSSSGGRCCGASTVADATTAAATANGKFITGPCAVRNTVTEQSCNCSHLARSTEKDETDFVHTISSSSISSSSTVQHQQKHQQQHHQQQQKQYHNLHEKTEREVASQGANDKVNGSSSAVVTSSSFSHCTLQSQQQQEELSDPIPPFANASVAEKNKMVHELCQQLVLSKEQILELNYRILHEIKRGLAKDTHSKANVKCFVTYVQDLPNGNERGKFLALDLGGTNFRVLLIRLSEDHDFQMESRIYAVPQHIMVGSGVQLFDHIAECLANFMSEHNVYKERLPLGFTFSFPLQQLGLTKGLLVTWTKGFNCAGVVNEDVVQMLKDAIARRGDVQIDVCAILNDTTGTLMSCAWKNRHCKIGLIVGTGSNACYVERVEEAELFDGQANGKSHVLINTEWGAFGDNGALDFVRTEFDKDVDEHSINPGKQTFEKMISGMYMGELVRLVIVKMVKAGVLFKGQNSDVLMTRGQFFTKYVSEIEADEPGTYTNCRLVLEELGLTEATDDDCANVRHICECVSKRAAHLVSCGIATLINKMDEPRVTVGVDGSVYRFHPKFHNLMVEKITELLKPGIDFDLMLSEDGSGRGAALVAAVACREDNAPRK